MIKHFPLVSVIIPVFNEEKRISRCIESIITQSLENIEIIVVDDGSTDSTYSILEEYSKCDKRIKLLKKKNEGQGIARNYALERATGKYIGFVDADDTIDMNMFEVMYNKIVEENSDICLCSLKSNTVKRTFSKNDIECDILGQALDSNTPNVFGCAVWNKLYSSNIIKNNNIKFVSERKVFSEDLAFNICYMSHTSNISIIDVNYYNYDNNNSISYTHTYKNDYLKKSKELYNYIINSVYQEKIDDKKMSCFLGSILLEIELSIRQEILYHDVNRAEKFKMIETILNDKYVENILKSVKKYKLAFKRKLLVSNLSNKYRIYYYLLIKYYIRRIIK